MMVSNNFMKIQMGEGVFEQAVLEIQVGGGGEGGQKTVPSVVEVWIFSGITQLLIIRYLHYSNLVITRFIKTTDLSQCYLHCQRF